MRGALSILVFLLVTISISHADNKTFLGSVKLPPEAQNLSPSERNDYIGERTLIVMGKGADLIERGAMEAIKASNPSLLKSEQVDEPADFAGHLAVILVGGPEHNSMTKETLPGLNNSLDMGYGITAFYGQINGTVVVAVADEQSFHESKELQGGLAYSPLAGLVPEGMETAAATTLSLLILALINILRTVFEFKALDYGRKGKKVGEGAVMLMGVNLSEMGALISASTVLGISISWQFFGPTMDFLNFIIINSMVCLMAALIHEITHRVVGRKFGIKVEYRFWKAGSALTLLSSYLGNAFSIQGFVLEEVEEGTEKWKVGLMKLSAPIVSALCMIGFAALFIFLRDPLLKTAYLTSSLWAMAEILPFRSLDGADIKKWNFGIWLGAFAFIAVSYVLVIFFI